MFKIRIKNNFEKEEISPLILELKNNFPNGEDAEIFESQLSIVIKVQISPTILQRQFLTSCGFDFSIRYENEEKPESNIVVLEFYPSPYEYDDLDTQTIAWEKIHAIIDDLGRKGYNFKAMSTGVRGFDCFYQIEGYTIAELKNELEKYSEKVEIDTVTTIEPKTTFSPALRIYVENPARRMRHYRS